MSFVLRHDQLASSLAKMAHVLINSWPFWLPVLCKESAMGTSVQDGNTAKREVQHCCVHSSGIFDTGWRVDTQPGSEGPKTCTFGASSEEIRHDLDDGQASLSSQS